MKCGRDHGGQDQEWGHQRDGAWKRAGDKSWEARLSWFGQTENDGEYIAEQWGWKWHAGGLEEERRRRFVAAVREDVDLDGVREEDAEN